MKLRIASFHEVDKGRKTVSPLSFKIFLDSRMRPQELRNNVKARNNRFSHSHFSLSSSPVSLSSLSSVKNTWRGPLTEVKNEILSGKSAKLLMMTGRKNDRLFCYPVRTEVPGMISGRSGPQKLTIQRGAKIWRGTKLKPFWRWMT